MMTICVKVHLPSDPALSLRCLHLILNAYFTLDQIHKIEQGIKNLGYRFVYETKNVVISWSLITKKYLTIILVY
jgi:hypothetical protein